MHKELIPYIIFGTLLITAFAAAIVFSVVVQKQRQFRNRLARQQLAFEHSQALLNTRIEVQETTLNTLARELHDHIAQMLTGCFMQLSLASGHMEGEKGKAIMEAAKANVKDVIRDVRLLSQSLASGMIERRELQEVIQTELNRIQAFSSITCTLASNSILEPDPEQRLFLFRIVQEALQNVIRHANAKHIDVSIDATDEQLRLQIRDDGDGFDVAAARQNASQGLLNMEQRAATLGGSLQLTSVPGSGTTITLEVPVNSLYAKDTNRPG